MGIKCHLNYLVNKVENFVGECKFKMAWSHTYILSCIHNRIYLMLLWTKCAFRCCRLRSDSHFIGTYILCMKQNILFQHYCSLSLSPAFLRCSRQLKLANSFKHIKVALGEVWNVCCTTTVARVFSFD